MDRASTSSVRAQVSEEEWALRCELAAAHRLVAHFVFVDLTYNHLSARLPDNPAHFLVKPATVFMEQVTASNLVKYDLDGQQVLLRPNIRPRLRPTTSTARFCARDPNSMRCCIRTRRPTWRCPRRNTAC